MINNGRDGIFLPKSSFWFVRSPQRPARRESFRTPLCQRGVWGDFIENRFIQKIPLNPPLPKGEDTRKGSLRIIDSTSGNDNWLVYISFENFQLRNHFFKRLEIFSFIWVEFQLLSPINFSTITPFLSTKNDTGIP
jgi:hypothetical protein